MTIEEMTLQREVLLAARYAGIHTVEIDGRRVTYWSTRPKANERPELLRASLSSCSGLQRSWWVVTDKSRRNWSK
jgi:hypothetical protein